MKKEIPIWEKVTLSVNEASAYSGIGEKKLREIIREDECPFVRLIDRKHLIIRKLFEKFLEEEYSV